MFKMQILSGAGVMYIEHIILDKVIGKYRWEFIVMINTFINKFHNLIIMKFRKSECGQQEYHVMHFAKCKVICY